MIRVYRGDDVDFEKMGQISISILSEMDLTGCVGSFEFLGVVRNFSEEEIAQRRFTFSFTAEETEGFCPGLNYGVFTLYDSECREMEVTKVLVEVVDGCPCNCCTEASEIAISIDNAFNYGKFAGKPAINGESLVGDKTGADLGLLDKDLASPSATPENPLVDEAWVKKQVEKAGKPLTGETMPAFPNQAQSVRVLQSIFRALGGSVTMVALSLSIPIAGASGAATGVDSQTIWWEAPPTNTIYEVGKAAGLVTTGALDVAFKDFAAGDGIASAVGNAVAEMAATNGIAKPEKTVVIGETNVVGNVVYAEGHLVIRATKDPDGVKRYRIYDLGE